MHEMRADRLCIGIWERITERLLYPRCLVTQIVVRTDLAALSPLGEHNQYNTRSKYRVRADVLLEVSRWGFSNRHGTVITEKRR